MIMSNGIITPALKASAYCLSGDNWNSHNFDFELGILPLYSNLPIKLSFVALVSAVK